jgi:hypothetical protein
LTKHQPETDPERPTPGVNGTGGVPPIPPRPISMLSWRRVTSTFDPAADKTQSGKRAAVATAPRQGDRPAPGASRDTGESQGTDRAIPPLADQTAKPTAKPTSKISAPPGPGAPKKPLVIAAGKRKRAPVSREAAHEAARIGGQPRSKAGRVVVLVALAATLVTTLAVAAPLGAGSGLAVAFQAYGNAMPWRAPAAPAQPPVASSANPGKQAIIGDIQAVFGQYSAGALNIARCESEYDPNAWNPTPVLGSHASGVFQILYPITWNGTPYRGYSPYNSWANIRAAYEIFKRDGYSWREWQCRP